MCNNVPTEGLTEAREVTVDHFGLVIVTEKQSGRIFDFFFWRLENDKWRHHQNVISWQLLGSTEERYVGSVVIKSGKLGTRRTYGGRKKNLRSLCLLSWEIADCINKTPTVAKQSKRAESWFICSYRDYKARKDFKVPLRDGLAVAGVAIQAAGRWVWNCKAPYSQRKVAELDPHSLFIHHFRMSHDPFDAC